MFVSLFILLLFVAPAAIAAPTSLASLQKSNFQDLTRGLSQKCTLNKLAIPVPAGISLTKGEALVFATVGRGVQNYTCTAGKFVSAGAVAK